MPSSIRLLFVVFILLGLNQPSCVFAQANPQKTEDEKVSDPVKAEAEKKSHLIIEEIKPLNDEELTKIWQDLTAGDWSVRERATRRLMAAGESAKELLQRGRSHPDPEVRLRVALVSRRIDDVYSKALEKLVSAQMARRAYEILLEFRQNKKVLRQTALRRALNYSGSSDRIDKEQAAAMQLMIEFATPDDTEKVVSLLNRDFQVSVDSGADSVAINSPFYSVLACLYQLPRERVLAAVNKVVLAKGAEQNAFPRVQACIALAFLGGREVLPILKQVILTRGTTVKVAALQALEQVAEKPEDVDFLKKVIKNEDEDVCRRCVRIFGMLEDKSAVPEILKALERDSDAVQIEAIRSLGLIADARAEKMLRLFASPKLPVTPSERKSRLMDLSESRGLAFWALARIGKASEVELLRLIEAGEGVEYMALLALAELGTDKAFKLLKTQVLRTDKKAAEFKLSRRALRVMGAMSNNKIVSDFLTDLALEGDSGTLRQSAVEALRDQGDNYARKKIAKLAGQSISEQPRVVATAILAVGKMGIHEAKPALLRHFYSITKNATALDLRSSDNFSVLVEALGNLGGKDSIQAFKSIEQRFVIDEPKRKRAKKKPAFIKPPRKDGKIYLRATFDLYLDLANACAHCGDNSLIDPAVTIFYNDRDAQLNGYSRTTYTSANLNRLGILLLYARKWDRSRFTFNRQQWTDDRGRRLNVQVYNHACTSALTGKKPLAISDLYLAYYTNHGYWSSDGYWRHFCTDLDLKALNGNVHYEKMKRQLRAEYFFRQGR